MKTANGLMSLLLICFFWEVSRSEKFTRVKLTDELPELDEKSDPRPAVALVAAKTGLALLKHIMRKDSTCKGNYCAWGNRYPCNAKSNFNYGCKGGYCWSQCSVTAFAKEWCWTVWKRNSKWMTCSTHRDCVQASQCRYARCSGGCSV